MKSNFVVNSKVFLPGYYGPKHTLGCAFFDSDFIAEGSPQWDLCIR